MILSKYSRRSPRLNNLSVEKRALENPKPSPVSNKQPGPVELPISQHKILADDEFLISFESPERVDSKNVFEGSQNTAGASPVQEEQIEQEEPTMELTNIASENHDEEISEEEEMEMELSRVMDSEDEQNDDLVDEHSMEMTRPLNTMENEVSDDEMDFTVAIGQEEEVGIVEEDEQTMDMTRSIWPNCRI